MQTGHVVPALIGFVLGILVCLRKVDHLRKEVERLRQSVRVQHADNLCWLGDPEIGKILPEEMFLESCKKYHRQLRDEKGILKDPGRTMAQLLAENERLRMQIEGDPR